MGPIARERIWTWSGRLVPCAGALIFLAIGWESLPPWHAPSNRMLPIERGGAPLERFAPRERDDATASVPSEDRAATDAISDRSAIEEPASAARSDEAGEDVVATGARTVAVEAQGASEYWLNLRSGVRHNRECRYFDPTGDGRYCGPDDGRACRVCGG